MASQAPLGTHSLWNTPGVDLPGPFRALVRELRKNGVEGSRSFAVAWSQARKWAAKGNAKWARVVAELEAARAKAEATPNKTSHEAIGVALCLAALNGRRPSGSRYKTARDREHLVKTAHAADVERLPSVEQVAMVLALAKHRAAQRYRHGWIPIVPEAKRGGPGKHAKPENSSPSTSAKSRKSKATPSTTADKVTTGEKSGTPADHATRISAADGLRGARAYAAKLSTADLKAVDVEMRRRRELLGSKAKSPRHQAVKDEIAKRLKRKTTPKRPVKAAHEQDRDMTDFDIDAARLALGHLQTQLDALALAMPPALAKAQAARKGGKKPAVSGRPATSTAPGSKKPPFLEKKSGKTTVTEDDAKDPKVAATAKKLMDKGFEEERAWKMAKAILKNRKTVASGGKAGS